MGKLIDFVTSVGNDKKSSHETPAHIKIKLFNKRLARQISKMEIQESRARKKAIEARKSGNMEQAKIYMKSSLQFRKWMNSSESFKIKMEGIQYKLEQARAMESFTGVAQDVASVLKSLETQVQVPEVSKIISDLEAGFNNMDKLMENVSGSLENAENASETAVSDTEVEEELAKVDLDLGLAQGSSLPSAPEGGLEEMESGEDIGDLEKEIEKLKAQRG